MVKATPLSIAPEFDRNERSGKIVLVGSEMSGLVKKGSPSEVIQLFASVLLASVVELDTTSIL